MPAKYGLAADAPKRSLRWLYLPFMLLMAVGSITLVTQCITVFFNYSHALRQGGGPYPAHGLGVGGFQHRAGY